MTANPLILRVTVKGNARRALEASPSPEAAVAASMEAARAFDAAWIAARPAEEARGALACRSGCDACCHQHVAVLPVEAVAIAYRLRLDEAGSATLRARAAETAAAIAGLGAADRRRLAVPCSFLAGDGGCAIYPMRPLRCRGLHSRSALHCADLAGADIDADGTVYPLTPLHLADAALAGLAEASAAQGVPRATLELSLAVAALLRAPARLQAVMEGGDTLDEARLPEPRVGMATG